jgi:hypothetical protein
MYLIQVSFLIIVFMALTLYAALVISHKNIYDAKLALDSR